MNVPVCFGSGAQIRDCDEKLLRVVDKMNAGFVSVLFQENKPLEAIIRIRKQLINTGVTLWRLCILDINTLEHVDGGLQN